MMRKRHSLYYIIDFWTFAFSGVYGGPVDSGVCLRWSDENQDVALQHQTVSRTYPTEHSRHACEFDIIAPFYGSAITWFGCSRVCRIAAPRLLILYYILNVWFITQMLHYHSKVWVSMVFLTFLKSFMLTKAESVNYRERQDTASLPFLSNCY